LLEYFDIIHNSPSHIYHSALPFSPSSSWLCKYYGPELSQEVQVFKGLPAEWGTCFRTISLDRSAQALSCWNSSIALGLLGGDIIILNAITGSQAAILSGHTISVCSVTYSSNGILLASGGHDKTAKLWDMQTGGLVKTLYGHTGSVLSVSISADCTRIASGSSDCIIHLWDIQTGECYCVMEQGYSVECVSFSPTDPQYLLSISNQVRQWDINGHQIGPTYDSSCFSFSPDGTQFVLCHRRTVTVQNSSSGMIVTEFQIDNGHSYQNCIHHCYFSPDGRLIAAAEESTIYIWDITNTEPHLIETIVHIEGIVSIAFSSPSSLISIARDRSTKFWQIGALLCPVITHPESKFPISHELRSITLQAKDGIIITSDSDGIVKTWDILTCLCKASFQTPATLDDRDEYYMLSGGRLSYNEDVQLINGRLIIVWHRDQKINAWDVERGESLFVVDGPDKLQELIISGDGSRVFCLGERFIQALSVQTGEIVSKVHVDYYTCPPLTTDGSRVWVNPDHGWDFGTLGSLPVQLPNIPPYRLHPNVVMLWDISLSRVKDQVTGKVVFQLPKKYRAPVDVQWNGQYLVACFLPIEVLILDFSNVL
jgi:WD40 repeat protein